MATRVVHCCNCHTLLHVLASAKAIRCAVCDCLTHFNPSCSNPSISPSCPYAYAQCSRIRLRASSDQPSPLQYSPNASLREGSKKAVICGISYKNTSFQLDGCINDAMSMKYLLTTKFQYPESAIVMLTDEEDQESSKLPTKRNIRSALRWLVGGCRAGDSLVFHFSGHGLQQRDCKGEELDGYDETICPVDFLSQGMIVDDELNETMVRPLKHGVRLHAVVDACHSGTVLDLPFLWKPHRCGSSTWEDHRPPTGTWKGTSGGEAFCFSGCDDDQSSTDTSALSNVTSTGAMTFCFIQAIERGDGNTYASLLKNMRENIAQQCANKEKGIHRSTLMQMMLARGSYKAGKFQEPQLTASYRFDVYRRLLL